MILYLDLETFCETPITYGTHRYAEDAEIMVAAYAIDDGPVEVLDCTAPQDMGWNLFKETLYDAERVVVHNSHFDRTVLDHRGLGFPVEKIDDTMVLAMQHSLPGGLAKLCEIFKLPVDQAKSAEGKKLIQLFCKPRPKNSKLRRATRETHPKDWAAFLDYARLDIEAMRAIYKKLPRWNNTPEERALWRLDQAINDRGVAIDMDLVAAANAAIAEARGELTEQAQEITLGVLENTTQRDKMMAYILDAHGIQMEDMKASTLERMLENDNYPPELLELLRVRLQATTTSTAKYATLARSTSRDGRLRGTLQFCGASRTGRWAGRLFQPQNLPRPSLLTEVIEAGVDWIKRGRPIEPLAFGSTMELLSSSLRGCIVAPPGRKLVVADLSNIEGRVLAWLAGEQWKLDAFAAYDRGEGEDLYKITAGRILGKPAADVTKAERQEVGKVAELALGYEGGVGAFITFATAYAIDLDALAAIARENLAATVVADSASMWDWMTKTKKNTFGLDQSTWIGIDAIKRAWRLAHPATTAFWKDMEDAARYTVGSGRESTAGRISFKKSGAWLRMILPSGRSLCYPAAAIGEGGKLTYTGVNQYSRRFERLGTYGGKLVENPTQAVARDALAFVMLLAEAAGYQIVLSVHDELICEAPDTPEFSAEGLAAIMATNAPWSGGLPLAAAGFETYRYRKG